MNAMHISVPSLFLVSNSGMLQPLPLKLNFVPKFALSYVVEWTIRLIPSILQFLLQVILDINGICCPEFLLHLPLSNSEQQSLKFHSTLSLLGPSLELSMFSTTSMAYRVLLVVPASLPNWVLGLPSKNGLDTFSVHSRFPIWFYRS
jgi:hypothetical protein